MDRGLMDAFEIKFRSAFRNLNFAILLGAMLFAPCFSVSAQQPAKIPRLGFLDTSTASASAVRFEAFWQEIRNLGWVEGKNITIEYRFAEQDNKRLPELAADLVRLKVDLIVVVGSGAAVSARSEPFRRGLRELGYVEGKNIVIEWRYAEGKLDRLPALASELARLKVDIIVSGGAVPTRAAKEATDTIPIVMTQDPDPVGSGFVASLARPGGNITGLSTLSPEISGKRLELLKEIVPKLSRVAVLGTSTRPGTAQELKEVELAAGALGVKLQYLDVLEPKDIETAFRAASKGRAEAVLFLVAGPVVGAHRTQVADLAVKRRLPVIYGTLGQEYVEAGGLMTYGVNINDLDRRAATYVDKILKGTKPADLPVEQPTKFELIINLKAAKQIGLTIPPNVLARADKVIR